MKKLGFTLAEVLITLSIIGVVAAMTVPTLMNNTSETEYRTGLKKAVSELTQAVTMNYALHGFDFGDLNGTAGTQEENDAGVSVDKDGTLTLSGIIGNRMSVKNKDCSITGVSGICYTLADGMYIAFTNTQSGCTKLSSACVVYVDVNGSKKPNKLSEKTNSSDDTSKSGDIYKLKVYRQSVVPGDAPAEYMFYGKEAAAKSK